MTKPPLILTLKIDESSFSYFNQLRQAHFPADRNFIDAHITLFHALPNESSIFDIVNGVSRTTSSFQVEVVKPVSIGKGTAFKLFSSVLETLHKTLQKQWFHLLTLQDRQKLWPHITVQNKVSVPEAIRLLAELNAGFSPFYATALGLQIWEYLNGPWKLKEEFLFNKV